MPPETSPAIVWFRQDLRISDNPALFHAASFPILPVFIWDEENPSPPGSASQWFLGESLLALKAALAAQGLTLIFKRGTPLRILETLISEHTASALYWNRCYDPHSIARDKKIKEAFSSRLDCRSFNGSLLREPWEIQTSAQTPFRVFTPYWKAFRTLESPLPAPLEGKPLLKGYPAPIPSDDIQTWGLHPSKPDWSQGLAAEWTPGEQGAQERLSLFLKKALPSYHEQRDYPAQETSKLSPHLHWGDISPRQIWAATSLATIHTPGACRGAETFLKELGWREFAHSLLYYFPTFPQQNFQKKFDHFPWQEDPLALSAWQQGKTGYPFVDAGMRELWQTGYMHNRVRMIVGSFLVKNLLIHWHRGEDWFWDCLVDADLANNSVNWQWVAGSGADAAPYFRIFNPVTQGKKFDPEGHYIRKFIPELSPLPTKYLFNPQEAPESILRDAGVTLGKTYPFPLVDLSWSRERALEAFSSLPHTPHA